jgi:hypothetical protein
MTNLIASYAAFPMFLHNETRGFGAAWYVAMLRAGKMQGPFGATVSCTPSGNNIAADWKILTKIIYAGYHFGFYHAWFALQIVVAFDNGLSPLIRQYLNESGKYDDFLAIVDREYGILYNNGTFYGEEHDFKLPSKLLPTNGTKYTSCYPKDVGHTPTKTGTL